MVIMIMVICLFIIVVAMTHEVHGVYTLHNKTLQKKTKLEIWAKPNMSLPGALSPIKGTI